MITQSALQSEDPELRLSALEQLICEALQLGEADLEALAAAYRALSAALLSRQRGASGQLSAKQLGISERARLGVWGLIYGVRSFEIARALDVDFGASVAELGSGWGPFSLAAALGGAEVELVDLAGPNLKLGEQLLSALGLPCETRRADLLRWQGPAQTIILPYVVNEVFGREEQLRPAVKQLSRWLAGPAEQLVIVDPGDQRSAQFLMALRERLRAEGLYLPAPCCAQGACPLYEQDKQWCHFTWRLPLGPFGRRIADRAGRKWKEAHFSWITVSKRPPEPAPEAARLLELRPLGRPKLQLRLCAAEGLVQLNVQRKQKAAFLHASALRPGQRLIWDRSMALRGDGYRLEQPGQLRAADLNRNLDCQRAGARLPGRRRRSHA